MSRILRIASLLAVVTSFIGVIYLVFFASLANPQIEEFLNKPGVIEKFRKLADKAGDREEQISPLVKQANALALRLDPPPPLVKKRPKTTPRQKKSDIPRPTRSTAKFRLVATCRYEQDSQKSLALLEMPTKGLKWYRQGDEVGHLIIEQIKDGSIIYKDGQTPTEIFTPAITTIKPLLKSDADAAAAKAKIPAAARQFTEPTVITPDKQPLQKDLPRTTKTRKVLPKTTKTRKDSPGTAQQRRRTRRTKARSLSPKAQREEEKKSMDDNIRNVQKIIEAGDDQGEVEELRRVLEVLEKERDEF